MFVLVSVMLRARIGGWEGIETACSGMRSVDVTLPGKKILPQVYMYRMYSMYEA